MRSTWRARLHGPEERDTFTTTKMDDGERAKRELPCGKLSYGLRRRDLNTRPPNARANGALTDALDFFTTVNGMAGNDRRREPSLRRPVRACHRDTVPKNATSSPPPNWQRQNRGTGEI